MIDRSTPSPRPTTAAEPPFCANCKHYTLNACRRGPAFLNVVTGYTQQKYRDPDIERGPAWCAWLELEFGSRCGPEGRFYVPKT